MALKRILITNDDGITAPGIKALEQSLAAVGDVTVVAPDTGNERHQSIDYAAHAHAYPPH